MTLSKKELLSYDHYIFAFSGGKDCTATLLWAIEQGVPREKMELFHHDIDGNSFNFMDYEITPDYCRKFAEAFNIPIYFSFKEGGFYREMMRDNTATAPNHYEVPTENGGKAWKVSGGKGDPNTRLKWPMVTGDLSKRWCSAYLKIDVGCAALRGQERFRNSKTLFFTGERAEESANRAKYKIFEPHKVDARDGKLKRHIDHFRPVLHDSEKTVWNRIQYHKVQPHPAYFIGRSRVSCKRCIFEDANGFATINEIDPKGAELFFNTEDKLNHTLKPKCSLKELVSKGTVQKYDPYWAKMCVSYNFDIPIFTNNWVLPMGAYKKTPGAI